MVDSGLNARSGRSTHQSLGRGLSILETVASVNGGASLAEVVNRTGLARSTTHYLMQALVSLGYLNQQPNGRTYQLGLKAFRLAGRSLNVAHIATMAMPILNELCLLTKESVAIGLCKNGSVTLVATRDTDGPVRVVQSVGAQRPIHGTALGKVLMAWLPDAERNIEIRKLTYEKIAPKTITGIAQFERELKRVRSAGYAIDDEEFIAGVRCLAAPVFDDTGEVKLALSVVGPKHRMTHQRLKECRPLVLECANRLGAEISSADI